MLFICDKQNKRNEREILTKNLMTCLRTEKTNLTSLRFNRPLSSIFHNYVIKALKLKKIPHVNYLRISFCREWRIKILKKEM